MFFSQEIEFIPELVHNSLSTLSLKNNAESVEQGITYMIQIGKPHYQVVLKQYILGSHLVYLYQSSLDNDYFDRSDKTPNHGPIDRSKFAYGYEQESKFFEQIFPYQDIKKFVELVSETAGYRFFGMDYLMNEEDKKITLIDMNSFSGYKNIADYQVRDSIRLELFQEHAKKFGQSPFGKISIEISTGKLSLVGPSILRKNYNLTDFGNLSDSLKGRSWKMVYNFGMNLALGKGISLDEYRPIDIEGEEDCYETRLMVFEEVGAGDGGRRVVVTGGGVEGGSGKFSGGENETVVRLKDEDVFDLYIFVSNDWELTFA